MRLKSLFISFCIVLFTTGCYLPISGRVIDAETQQPIVGAVVLVEWTKKYGFGDAWTESYKVVESISDKEGKVKIGGCYSLFVEPPDVTVYKKGYVAWSSQWIFPSGKNRGDFQWGSGYFFQLQYFMKNEYSYDAHTSFISSSINSSLKKNYELKKTILHAVEWEEQLALQERLKKINSLKQ